MYAQRTSQDGEDCWHWSHARPSSQAQLFCVHTPPPPPCPCSAYSPYGHADGESVAFSKRVYIAKGFGCIALCWRKAHHSDNYIMAEMEVCVLTLVNNEKCGNTQSAGNLR